MKKTLIPALIGLLAFTVSADPIATINDDSATLLDFTVVWGAGFALNPSTVVLGPVHKVNVFDNIDSIVDVFVGPGFLTLVDEFKIFLQPTFPHAQ